MEILDFIMCKKIKQNEFLLRAIMDLFEFNLRRFKRENSNLNLAFYPKFLAREGGFRKRTGHPVGLKC